MQKAALLGKTLFHYSEHFSKNKSLMPLRYWHNHLLFRTLSRSGAIFWPHLLLLQAILLKPIFMKAGLFIGAISRKGTAQLDLSSKKYEKRRALEDSLCGATLTLETSGDGLRGRGNAF
jgi:hypothetical protein